MNVWTDLSSDDVLLNPTNLSLVVMRASERTAFQLYSFNAC